MLLYKQHVPRYCQKSNIVTLYLPVYFRASWRSSPVSPVIKSLSSDTHWSHTSGHTPRRNRSSVRTVTTHQPSKVNSESLAKNSFIVHKVTLAWLLKVRQNQIAKVSICWIFFFTFMRGCKFTVFIGFYRVFCVYSMFLINLMAQFFVCRKLYNAYVLLSVHLLQNPLLHLGCYRAIETSNPFWELCLDALSKR